MTPTKTAKLLGIDKATFELLHKVATHHHSELSSPLKCLTFDVGQFPMAHLDWPPKFSPSVLAPIGGKCVARFKYKNYKREAWLGLRGDDTDVVRLVLRTKTVNGGWDDLVVDFDNAEQLVRTLNELSWNLDLP